ncbi:hypothetical protein DOTSEDRAFT_142100 [Dothistroma septosporum NZE10]|uniref:Nuclear pore complex protein n=1 Tax=Dothistroma septosporum (strain NZE10 / CBS 128990) TaxID=675120 RepID=N1PZA3_DOTSN|nr:hypothetical protein DOTSEDRAFT_142100 [Dothistroma septosporum NZE10]
MDGQNGHSVVPTREPAKVNDAISPLREMAERVGKEVELFAEELDKFLDNLPTRNKFDAVLELADQFKRIAEHAATKLKETHGTAIRQQRQEEWEQKANIPKQTAAFGAAPDPAIGTSTSDKTAEQVKRLRQWQQEVDIWELFRIMLELHHNPDVRSMQQEKEDKLRSLGEVHRYTSEQDIWKRFLVHDDLAKERAMVKRWLEETAEHQESDIPGIMEELEKQAGVGKGMWLHGVVHTRATIKGEKRLRPWPNAPAAALPHITRADDAEPLVTQLDPDAASRQGRVVERKDAFFEQVMWIACWEMLRRGKSWQEVTDWCKTRNESWRALSMGKVQPTEALSTATWRSMCYLASKSTTANDYEAAVYGLLSGNVTMAQKAARTVDENLYVHYNAALIRQFDLYLEMHHTDRLPRGRLHGNRDLAQDPDAQIVELIGALRKKPTTSREAVQPIKIIQSYLLANDVGSLIHTLGFTISYTARQTGKADHMILDLEPFWQEDSNQPEAEVALNPQTLRIATHMGIMIRQLAGGMARKENQEREAEENVYVAYIQSLRAAGKRELIPLYLSKLHASRYIVTMADILEDITSPREQDVMLRLMRQYELDVILILRDHSQFLMNKYMSDELHPQTRRPAKILEKAEDTLLYPGQRIILGFFSDEPQEGDDAIVRSLRWFTLVDGYWQETFAALSLALRKSLVAGRLACALQIIKEFPYDNVALRKNYKILGRSINPFDHEGEPPCGRARWDFLRRTSRCYYELELVVRAIASLHEWRIREAEYTQNALRMSSAPPLLKTAKEEVDLAMNAVLTRKLLTHPVGHDEAMDLDIIRREYIPEVIIAYNTVLHSAGSIITRNNLVQSMDLSVAVANEQNGLTDCFLEARRMKELVTSFAQTSKAMLILKEEGKPWKARKDREGKDLGIWEIGPQGTSAHGQDVSLY